MENQITATNDETESWFTRIEPSIIIIVLASSLIMLLGVSNMLIQYCYRMYKMSDDDILEEYFRELEAEYDQMQDPSHVANLLIKNSRMAAGGSSTGIGDSTH